MSTDKEPFRVDETPLREWVLKAYQENRPAAASSTPPDEAVELTARTLAAIRQFLSGAPGGASYLDTYWFEEDPDAILQSFHEDLERAFPGLAAMAFEPVIEQAHKTSGRDATFASNLGVYVSSLGGALAVRVGLDENVACALAATVIIGVSRLGPELFEQTLRENRTSG